MRRIWLVAAALALAACEPAAEDPSAAAFLACVGGSGDAEEREAAANTLIEAPDITSEQRAVAYHCRGDVKRGRGDVTGALRDYEQALSLNPDHPNALVSRARILLESGQLDAAEPLLRRAIQVHDSGLAREMMGRIALIRGDYAEAITFFDAALEVAPRAADAMSGRARAKERLGDLDGAAADYDDAVRLDSGLADARAGRCWLDLSQDRNLQRARTDAETAVAAEPRLVEAQICLGVLQLRSGEWANARASFEAALAVEPGNPRALFGRGVARRRSGDEAGRADMNQARDFSPHIGATFDDLGVETY